VIYYLHCGSTGLTKIGYAHDPVARCARIARMSPMALEIVGVRNGSRSDEGAEHIHWMDCRAHGEWFRLPSDAVIGHDTDFNRLLGDPLRPTACRCLSARSPCGGCRRRAKQLLVWFERRAERTPLVVDAISALRTFQQRTPEAERDEALVRLLETAIAASRPRRTPA
jgi:hypothetical protein